MTPLVWKEDPSLSNCLVAFSDKLCVGFVAGTEKEGLFSWEITALPKSKHILTEGLCPSLDEGQTFVQTNWDAWCNAARLEAQGPSFLTQDLTLVQLLHHASSEDYKGIADSLEKIRKRIPKDNTEEWNALNAAIFYIRVEANKHSKLFKGESDG